MRALLQRVSEASIALEGEIIAEIGVPVETGRFRSHMAVRLVNDGPVTIWLDTSHG